MHEKIKNVIWDWNGTIMNDIRLCTDIANNILRKYSLREISVAEYRSEFGFPIADFYERMGIDFIKVSFEELTHSFIEEYESRIDEIELHEGIEEVLSLFSEMEIDQHILTAAHVDFVYPKLKHFGINHYFDQVEGQKNHNGDSKVGRGIQMIKKMAFDRGETVMIGDTDHDLEVAEALGIRCILVANGHQSMERLSLLKGNFELVDVVLRIPKLILHKLV